MLSVAILFKLTCLCQVWILERQSAILLVLLLMKLRPKWYGRHWIIFFPVMMRIINDQFCVYGFQCFVVSLYHAFSSIKKVMELL